jgi:hypothetical protein
MKFSHLPLSRTMHTMNLFPLRGILRTRGPALDTLTALQRGKAFPGARIDGVCSSLRAKHIVLGIGQMHPVLSGKFARLQARSIGVVQAWIFRACAALVRLAKVDTFGQEGFSTPDGRPVRARANESVLESVRREAGSEGNEGGYLRTVAARWRLALARRDATAAAEEAFKLNGLVMLQARDQRVGIFPIEHQAIHGAVGENIHRLQGLITQVEATAAYQGALGKGGKDLTKEEYDAVMRRNELIHAFNTAIASPERDRAMFQAVVEQAELERKRRNDVPGQVLSVFVLGAAHRRGFLTLAKQHLPGDMLFVWVTPAPLLFMRRLRDAIVAAILLAILLLGIASQIVLR